MATTIWSNKQLYHWGSGGYIKMDASYDYYRNGANMVYSLSVTVKQTGSGSWFNDKVGCQIKLDGTEVYYNATLKGSTSSSTTTTCSSIRYPFRQCLILPQASVRTYRFIYCHFAVRNLICSCSKLFINSII